MLSLRRLARRLGTSTSPLHLQHIRLLTVTRPATAAAHSPKDQLPSVQQQITCRIKRFNTSPNLTANAAQLNAKFGSVELASAGWKHHKAKGDHFTIHPAAAAAASSIIDSAVPVSFDSLGLDERLVHNLRTQFGATVESEGGRAIERCTGVQAQAVPLILAGDHTLLAAETGCGKTLAYLVPIVQQVLQSKRLSEQLGEAPFNTLNAPRALVLTPGRELASQIASVASRLCDGLDIDVHALLGGRTKQLMLNPQLEHVDLLVGTMGATSKLVTSGVYRMQRCAHVVLDEADTLLDDSFNGKLVHFLRRFPFHRNHLLGTAETVADHHQQGGGTQLVLASATMPMNAMELLQQVVDPETVHEVLGGELHRMKPNVEQRFERCGKTERPVRLLRVIRDEMARRRPVIVFCNRSATSDYVSMFLEENGVGCANLNGDMPAALRLGKFERFQTGAVDVLATTDMASRGLDTTRARHIVNFDVPLHMADYIHRIGRTGRLGHEADGTGRCVMTSLVSSVREIDLVQRIEHAARTRGVLPNVNANITNIIKTRIMRELGEEMRQEEAK